MKAAVIDRSGPPEVLEYREIPDPQAKPTEIIVRNEAISIEGGDVSSRSGGRFAATPHVVGYQSAGEVVWVGDASGDFKVGDKVVCTGGFGSHAELRAVNGRTAWVLPPGMDIRTASAIPIPFGTADNCLLAYGHLEAGDTCFIQSGASGVGMAAIQIAKKAGARVIATASSDARLEPLYALGLDHGINSATENVVERVMEITEKKGVDVTLDGNGGRSLKQCVQVLGWKGRATFIGVTAREPMDINVASLMGGNRSLIGLGLGYEMATPRVRAMVQGYIDAIAAGQFTVLMDKTFPLSEAAAAHAYIESRAAVGRVVLIP